MRILQDGIWHEVELDLSEPLVPREVHARPPHTEHSQPRVAVMGPIIERIARATGEDSVTVHELLVAWFKPGAPLLDHLCDRRGGQP